jgi:hypothetical protein
LSFLLLHAAFIGVSCCIDKAVTIIYLNWISQLSFLPHHALSRHQLIWLCLPWWHCHKYPGYTPSCKYLWQWLPTNDRPW